MRLIDKLKFIEESIYGISQSGQENLLYKKSY